MGVFGWVSYREWSQLDSVESCETVGGEEQESCNSRSNQQVVLCFHQNVFGDIDIHVRREYGVETMSIWGFFNDTQI